MDTFNEANGLPPGVLGEQDLPTPAQKAYYVWLVMKRVRYVLRTTNRSQMSGVIEEVWQANKRDGMAYQDKTASERAEEARQIIKEIFS